MGVLGVTSPWGSRGAEGPQDRGDLEGGNLPPEVPAVQSFQRKLNGRASESTKQEECCRGPWIRTPTAPQE